jgi:HK97 family phage major capsid protein
METKNLGEFVAEAMKGLDHKGQKFSKAVSYKAAAVMDLPSAISPATTDVDKRIVEGYRRPLLVADLFAAERIAGNAITYFVESDTVEGGPSTVAEGAKKPMMSFGDPSAKTVSLQKIATYMKETDELIDDASWLADAINGRGMYQFELTVENYLINQLTGTSGLGTQDGLNADKIYEAIMQVQNDTGFQPDALVINPADYKNLRIAKDLNGQYYGGGYFYGPYGQGGFAGQPDVWGLRTVVTPAVAQGAAIVGAFKLGASVVSKNTGVTVEIANQNEDDFLKNLVTILIEQRLALAVRRPKAFVLLSADSES